MKCKFCNQDMAIINNKTTSELNSTDVYSQMTFACTNAECTNFAGNKFQNTDKLIKGDKIKI